MTTRFGKWLETEGFMKWFHALTLLAIGLDTLFTALAVYRLSGSWIWVIVWGTLTLGIGIIVYAQEKITKRWPEPKVDIFVGFVSSYLIYQILLLLLWLILSFFYPFASWRSDGILLTHGMALLIVTYGFVQTYFIHTKTYTLHLEKLAYPYRIVLVSDLHLGAFVSEKHIQKMVHQINQLHADLVVISGDIIDANNHILNDPQKLHRISQPFREIQVKEGIYAVLGNHDPASDDPIFRQFLTDAKIHLLDNQTTYTQAICLVGRSDASHHQRSDVDLKTLDPNHSIVVLDHNPGNIPEAITYKADLVLCGHTHKGQFFPITILTRMANGKHYFYGHETFGRTQAIITSGAGFFQLPIRIGTHNEIVDLQLYPPK